MERFYKVLLRVETPRENPFRASSTLSSKEETFACVNGMVANAMLTKEGKTIIQVREYNADNDWDEIRKITIDASGREGM